MKSDVNKTLYKVIKIAGTILLILLVAYGTMRASMIAYDFGYRVFTEPAMEEKPGTDVVVTIEKSMDAKDIAAHLLEKGLVRDANLFWLQYQLSAYKGELIEGTYTLNTSMTAKEMMVIMAEAGEEEEDSDDSSDKSTENAESTQTSSDTEAE
ncbi:MAG: endolytic transglycosylase MltG [Agathobacter sp.]|nr:endolytic transglycosylase MltG [Agathobacter sp.]